jgi:hypothetical protein
VLESIEKWLAIVEHNIRATDKRGENPVNTVLEQKNFSMLHKQYETIRAELVNTLNN